MACNSKMDDCTPEWSESISELETREKLGFFFQILSKFSTVQCHLICKLSSNHTGSQNIKVHGLLVIVLKLGFMSRYSVLKIKYLLTMSRSFRGHLVPLRFLTTLSRKNLVVERNTQKFKGICLVYAGYLHDFNVILSHLGM